MTDEPPFNILYVDDDRDIRHIVKLSLNLDPAIDLRMCASGDEALDLLASIDWRPELILMDVMMPGMDGPKVMAAMRARYGFADTPFVFVTARARAADVEAYLRQGATDVLLKPFDPLTLASRVRSINLRVRDR